MRSVKSDSNYNKQKISNKERGGYPHRIVAPRLMIEIRFILYSHACDHYDRALSYAYECSLELPQHTRCP